MDVADDRVPSVGVAAECGLEPSDLELARAVMTGDHGAFHALVARHGPALLRVALSLADSPSDAEDICQETFAAAFRGLRNFDGRASVKTWLTSILIRRASKLWKKERHARRTYSLHHDGAANERGRGNVNEALVAQASVPSSVEAVDQRMDVLEIIRSLAPEFREAIVLREIEGLSYQEIARVLNIPRGTVESRLYRGRAELRRKLTGY